MNMANDQPGGLSMLGLTKPKGVLLAVPFFIGMGLLISAFTGADRSMTSEATSTDKELVRSSEAMRLPNLAGKTDKPAYLQLAAADKPADGKFSADQEKQIGEIVRRYLLENPEVLVEVSAELEKRRKEEQEGNQAQVLVDEKKSIFRSPHDFVLGNPDGDITLVEYFDYNCGWCKRALTEVNKLISEDKRVRVVMKEFPIFGEDSTFAAKAALASIKQNKYWEFHTAMMQARKVTTSNTLEIAKNVGIDVKALEEEMKNPVYDQAIEENSRVAQALGMQGTPGFIVDSKVNFGYVPVDGLKKMLSEVRKEGCKIC
jgi:protein-disulfide isomerase